AYPDGLTGRDVQLVGGREAEIEILELPPPLVTDHLDLEGIRWRLAGRRKDGAHRGHGHEDEDHRRREGPGDLHERVTVRRRRSGAPFAVAEADERDDEHQ